MRYGVIAVNKNDICSILSDGPYNSMSNAFKLLKGNYAEDEILLIEMDEEEVEEIKLDALIANTKLNYYFSKSKDTKEDGEFDTGSYMLDLDSDDYKT